MTEKHTANGLFNFTEEEWEAAKNNADFIRDEINRDILEKLRKHDRLSIETGRLPQSNGSNDQGRD